MSEYRDSECEDQSVSVGGSVCVCSCARFLHAPARARMCLSIGMYCMLRKGYYPALTEMQIFFWVAVENIFV